MNNILSQIEGFSESRGLDNPEILVDESEIVITSEILNFDIGSALVLSIVCCLLIFVSENGFGYLLFITAMLSCYIMWSKLQYVNISHIDLSEKTISITRKLFKKEHKIFFNKIKRFYVKHIETSPAYRNYKINITSVDGSEYKLIDFNNEEAAKDFSRLMNMLLKSMKHS